MATPQVARHNLRLRGNPEEAAAKIALHFHVGNGSVGCAEPGGAYGTQPESTRRCRSVQLAHLWGRRTRAAPRRRFPRQSQYYMTPDQHANQCSGECLNGRLTQEAARRTRRGLRCHG